MSETNRNNSNRSETQTPIEILNIEEILKFEKNKRDDRDSVDTLDLIRDSTDLTKRTNEKKVVIIQNTENSYLTTKEISSVSSDHFQDIDDFKETPQDLETNLNGQNLTPYIDNHDTNQSRQSISSTQSSLNLGPNVYPLSITEKPDPSQEVTQDDSKYKIDKNVLDDEIETADLVHLEPKLRDAWIKMRKLDKILERATKKERMVKKETIKLIEKNRADLELLRLTSDHKESKQEAENTAHFLALSYFDLDDEIDREDDFKTINPEEPATPVFKTQVLDDLISLNGDSSTSASNQFNNTNNMFNKSIPKKTESISSDHTNQKRSDASKISTNKTKSEKSDKLNKSKQKNTNEKDFIKRNIQLVQDAGGALAMTDEEKARLNELLLDLEDNDDKNKKNFIKEGADENPTYLVEYNPFSVALTEGDGFTPDKNEMLRLKEIDSKLERRINNSSRLISDSLTTISEQFKGNSAFSLSGKTSKFSLNNTNNIDAESYSGLFNSESKQIRLNDDFDENEFGDKFIREARISREQENRLKFIDLQLEKFKIATQSNGDLETVRSESNSSLISQQQLKALLQECSYELSESSMNNNNNNKLEILKEEDDLVDENGSIYSNEVNNERRMSIVPVLNDDVIVTLLEQAKLEGIYMEQDNQNGSPVVSYYEEALEIVKSIRKLSESQTTRKEIETSEPKIENEEYNTLLNSINEHILKKESESDEEDIEIYASARSSSPPPPPITTHQISTIKYSFNETDDISINNSNKLPPLYANKNTSKEDTNEINNATATCLNSNEIRSTSALSNISSVSTSSLPKISSRYLPK